MDVSEKVAMRLAKTQIFQALLGLLLQFDTASILHGAIREFALTAVHVPQICDRALDILFPFLMNEVLSREHGFAAATCWAILDSVHRDMIEKTLATDRLARDREFGAFARRYLFPYRKMISDQYGGGLDLLSASSQAFGLAMAND
jgi:hypothetical protein